MMFGLEPFGVLAFGEADSFPLVFGSTSVTASVDANYQLFAGDVPFITPPGDAPANRPFDGTLDEPLDLDWRVLDGEFIGGLVVTTGKLTAINNDKRYDFLIGRYALDGRPVEMRYGRAGDLFKDWPVVFRGVASDFDVNESELIVNLEDHGYKLDVALQSRLYAGTGELEGTSDLAGKPIPLAFGYLQNATLAPVWPAMQLYQGHDGRCQAIPAVYDKGIPLTLQADYPTVEALLAATIAEAHYGTCLQRGYVRHYSNPAGVVTADIEGDFTGGVFAGTTAQVIRRILARSTELVEPADLYLAAFDVLETIQPAQIGYFAGHDDQQRVSEAIARLMKSIGGFAHFLRDGRLSVTRIGAPVGPPVRRFDATKFDVNSLKRQRLPDGVQPPPPRWRIGYARNWTVMTEPADGVSEDRRSFLAAQYRYGLAESASVAMDHPFSKERDPVEAYFRNKADADAEALRRLNQHSEGRAIYSFECDVRDGIELEMGHPIFPTHDRWGLDLGKDATVLGMRHSGKAGVMTILAYC